jgi:hypothetical protein
MTTASPTTVASTFVGLYQAVLGSAPPASLTAAVNTFLGSANGTVVVSYINHFVDSALGQVSDNQLATLVLNNLLGKTPVNSTALHDAMEALLAANHGNRGAVIAQATNLLSSLENDPTYGAAAHAYNDRVHDALSHSGVTLSGMTFAWPLEWM